MNVIHLLILLTDIQGIEGILKLILAGDGKR